MTAVIGSIALICFFIGFVCLIYPIKAIRIPTRRRAGVVTGISFLVFAIAVANTDTEPTQDESQSESTRLSQEDKPSKTELETQAPEETREPNEPVSSGQTNSRPDHSREGVRQTSQPSQVEQASWGVHPYKVIEDEDISSSNRNRRRITIVSPTANTREDRIATLIAAAKQGWQEHNSQYIGMFHLPFELGPTTARIDYAPDKCGVSGEDCSGLVWTNAHASEAIFSPEQIKIYTAWEKNKDEFKEFDEEFGFERINEERLKLYLAEQFDSTSEQISSTVIHVIASAMSQPDVMIPTHLEVSGLLSEEDQKLADSVACRSNLQCWGDKHGSSASIYCPDMIERLGIYDHEWVDGFFESKFSRFSWHDRRRGSLTYMGDQIKFQNAFGAWVYHIYHCDFDPISKQVIDVRAMPGRF